jgi:quercetin dioxygenase-like cupin family protein
MTLTRTAAFAAVLAFVAVQASAEEATSYENLLTTILSGNTTILDQAIAYPSGTPRITAAIITIPPGGQTGWHIHAVPLFAYILDGELTVDYGSKGTKVYAAGGGVLEAVNWPHNGMNKGEVPVSLIAVYMGAEGDANATSVAGGE